MAVKLKKYSLPIEVVPQKDMFGRRILNYKASFEGLEVTGKTADEAVALLRAAIGRMAARANDLLVVRWRGLTLLVHFEPIHDSWVVSRLAQPVSSEVPEALWLTSNYSLTHELEEAKKRVGHRPMRILIEQIVLQDIIKREYRTTDGPRIPCSLPDMDARELASWVEFNIRYAAAKTRGLDDASCQNYAGRNPAFRDLWEHEPREEFKLIQG